MWSNHEPLRLASPTFLPVRDVVEVSVGVGAGVERVPVAAVLLHEQRSPEPGVAVAARAHGSIEHGIARQAAPGPEDRLLERLLGRVDQLEGPVDHRVVFDYDPELQAGIPERESTDELPELLILFAQRVVLVDEHVVLIKRGRAHVAAEEPAHEQKGHRLSDRSPVPMITPIHCCTLSSNALRVSTRPTSVWLDERCCNAWEFLRLVFKEIIYSIL